MRPAFTTWKEESAVALALLPMVPGHRNGGGFTDLEAQDLVEPAMVWPLRRVTKYVVVTVLLQLV